MRVGLISASNVPFGIVIPCYRFLLKDTPALFYVTAAVGVYYPAQQIAMENNDEIEVKKDIFSMFFNIDSLVYVWEGGDQNVAEALEYARRAGITAKGIRLNMEISS